MRIQTGKSSVTASLLLVSTLVVLGSGCQLSDSGPDRLSGSRPPVIDETPKALFSEVYARLKYRHGLGFGDDVISPDSVPIGPNTVIVMPTSVARVPSPNLRDVESIRIGGGVAIKEIGSSKQKSEAMELSEVEQEKLQKLFCQLRHESVDPPYDRAVIARFYTLEGHKKLWKAIVYDSRDLPPEVQEILNIVGEDWSSPGS